MVQVITNETNRLSALKYPKLMITEKGTIVLMKDRSIGMVLLEGTSTYELGYYSNTWDMNNFSDYYEAITLQNELP